MQDVLKRDDVDALEALHVRYGIDGNSQVCWESLLHLATLFGACRCMLWALAHGADADAFNRYGDTPLMIAAENSQPQAFRLLLARGADLCIENARGDIAISRISGGWAQSSFFPDACGMTFAACAAYSYSDAQPQNAAAVFEYGTKDEATPPLPDELLVAVLSRCDARSLVRVAAASRALRRVAYDRDVVTAVASSATDDVFEEYVDGVRAFIMLRPYVDRRAMIIGIARLSGDGDGDNYDIDNGLRSLTAYPAEHTALRRARARRAAPCTIL
jgi:hypothetical protein